MRKLPALVIDRTPLYGFGTVLTIVSPSILTPLAENPGTRNLACTVGYAGDTPSLACKEPERCGVLFGGILPTLQVSCRLPSSWNANKPPRQWAFRHVRLQHNAWTVV
eukprot:COSAG02_NODE_1152_length_14201_cov_9.055595_11_plen_108_part_00